VIAVGSGKLSDEGNRLALAVKVGDIVLYGKYSGSDVEVNGKELKILRESDLLAKIAK
jgi:chaperonin GroES